MTRFAKLALIAATTLAASLALANDAHHAVAAAGTAAEKPASSTDAGSAMSEGEIRKVDKGAGKITIKHGPIPNLDMPNMTMVFRAKNPAMLDQVKPGDKVRFSADKINGVITVTKIEPAQ